MGQRVGVFIDWENSRYQARRAQGAGWTFTGGGHKHPDYAARVDGLPPWYGSVRPLAFARWLAQGRDLSLVGVYRGEPDRMKDAVAAGRMHRQVKAWRREFAQGGLIADKDFRIVTRPLVYKDTNRWRQEKGVDVAMAIDIVEAVLTGLVDVVVMVTVDTDQRPVRDFLVQRTRAHVEVVKWEGHPACLAGNQCVVRVIDKVTFESVMDRRDYHQDPPEEMAWPAHT